MSETTLDIFVSRHCRACSDTPEIAEAIRRKYPNVRLRILDFENGETNPRVFATPTYLINGSVVLLGNPTGEEIDALFGAAAIGNTDQNEAPGNNSTGQSLS